MILQFRFIYSDTLFGEWTDVPLDQYCYANPDHRVLAIQFRYNESPAPQDSYRSRKYRRGKGHTLLVANGDPPERR